MLNRPTTTAHAVSETSISVKVRPELLGNHRLVMKTTITGGRTPKLGAARCLSNTEGWLLIYQVVCTTCQRVYLQPFGGSIAGFEDRPKIISDCAKKLHPDAKAPYETSASLRTSASPVRLCRMPTQAGWQFSTAQQTRNAHCLWRRSRTHRVIKAHPSKPIQ